MAKPGVALEGEDWRYLVDAFRTHKIEYNFSLQNIQTIFTELGIQLI